MLVGGITKFHHPFMGGSQNSRGLKWGESQNSLWMRFTTLIFTHPRKKRLRLRLFSCYVTLIFNNSLISNELVDALKSSEFPWLCRLPLFSLLSKLVLTRSNWGIMNSRLVITDIRNTVLLITVRIFQLLHMAWFEVGVWWKLSNAHEEQAY